MLRIFLSYTRADHPRALEIDKAIASAGHDSWMDSSKLTGGQEWAREIRDSIKRSDAVIVCFSQGLSQARSYVHREWRLALDIMQELPEGTVYTIPLRLDDCAIPDDLAHLHTIDWFRPDGQARLASAFENVAQQKILRERDEFRQLFEPLLVQVGAVIHLNEPIGSVEDANTLAKYLFQNTNPSTELLEVKDWAGILTLWAPLSLNPFFDLGNSYIRQVGVARCRLQMAKSHIFFAHAWLSASDADLHVGPAHKLLEEILMCEPFPVVNLASGDLPEHIARIQNENYIFALNLADRWLSVNEAHLTARLQVSVSGVRDRVSRRKGQLQLL
jgi:hypothetical protein